VVNPLIINEISALPKNIWQVWMPIRHPAIAAHGFEDSM
jgi:hypothetical protein